jgi:hypothetical protein
MILNENDREKKEGNVKMGVRLRHMSKRDNRIVNKEKSRYIYIYIYI